MTSQVAQRNSGLNRHDRERGAATVEHMGIVAIVGLLVTAGVLGLANYGPHLTSRLCELATAMSMNPGACAPVLSEQTNPEALTDESFLPPVCTLRETSSQSNSEVKIGFLTFGENAGFVIAENADGTVTVTVTDGGALGAEVGVGAEVGKDGFGLGANVDFGGGISFEAGSTWKFENWDAWKDMEADFNAYRSQQLQFRHAGQGAAGLHLWLWLSNGYLEAPQDPTITTSTIGLDLYAEGKAGLVIETGVDSSGNSQWFDPNRGIYANGTLGGSVARTYDSETKETSETFTFTADGGVGVNWGFANAGGEGEFEQAYRITRDEHDEVISIEFMRETGSKWSGEIDIDPGTINLGGENTGSVQIGADKENQRTIQSTTLDVTGENRHIVEAWVNTNQNALAGNPFIYPANAFAPTTNVEGDPLAELLFQEGKGSLRVYDNVSSGFSFAAEFALGLKVGASLEYEESESTLNSAHFIGAPRTNGERAYIEDATCAM